MSAKKEINWKRNVAYYLSSQAVSLIGSSIVGYSIMWYVTLKTGSGVWMTIFTIATTIPMFIVSPFGGVFADRYSRRLLINISDAFIALAAFAVGVCFSFGADNVMILLICSIARSAGHGIQIPAENALIPQITPKDQLMRVNGLNAGIQNVMVLGSPALAGAMMSLAPLQIILYTDVVTAAIGIIMLSLLVKVPPMGTYERAGEEQLSSVAGETAAAVQAASPAEPDVKSGGYLSEMKDGIKYMLGHAFVKRLFIYLALFGFLFTPSAVLTPLQVTRSFGADVWRLTAIEIAFSAGMILGSLALSTWGGFKNRTVTVIVASFMFGAEAIALGLLTNFVLYIVCMGIMGVSMTFTDTPITTLLQEKVEPEYMGRIFAVMTMIMAIISPIGMAVFGPLSDVVSIELLLIITGVATLVLSGILSADRLMREAGKH